MINVESLRRLYANLSDKESFGSDEILMCGFNVDDIATLVRKKYIQCVCLGKYKVVIDDENLSEKFEKCLELMKNGFYEKANLLFLECLKRDNRYLDKVLNLVLDNINGEQYEVVLGLLRLVLSVNNDFYNRNVKFYLFLLNYLTDVPDDLKTLIVNLQYDDIYIIHDGVEVGKTKHLNNMRKNALSGENIYSAKINSNDLFEQITLVLCEKYSRKFKKKE